MFKCMFFENSQPPLIVVVASKSLTGPSNKIFVLVVAKYLSSFLWQSFCTALMPLHLTTQKLIYKQVTEELTQFLKFQQKLDWFIWGTLSESPFEIPCMVAGQFDAFMVLVSRVICLPYPINYHIYLQKLSLSFKQFIIEIFIIS